LPPFAVLDRSTQLPTPVRSHRYTLPSRVTLNLPWSISRSVMPSLDGMIAMPAALPSASASLFWSNASMILPVDASMIR
jgi:hypothetical protein